MFLITECSVVIFGVTFFREKSPGPYGPNFVLTDPGGAIFLATRQIAAKESPAAWPQYRENKEFGREHVDLSRQGKHREFTSFNTHTGKIVANFDS